MSPNEKTALEALVGRALTIEEEAAITTHIENGRRDDLVAQILNQNPRKRLESLEITPRGSAALFPSLNGLPGPLAFQKAMRKLDAWVITASSNPDEMTSLLGDATKEQLAGYRTRGLDFSVPALRSMLDLIASLGGITAQEAAGFKGLAEKNYPVDTNEVSNALNKAQGLMTLGG